MKQMVLFSALLLLGCSQPTSKPNASSTIQLQEPKATTLDADQLIGTWEGKDDKGQPAYIQFQPEGYIIISQGGTRYGGKNDKGISAKFILDMSHSPIWLDIILIQEDGNEVNRGKAILQVFGPNDIKIGGGADPRKRPKSFEESGPLSSTLHRSNQ